MLGYEGITKVLLGFISLGGILRELVTMSIFNYFKTGESRQCTDMYRSEVILDSKTLQ